MRIQAFEWLLRATSMIQGDADAKQKTNDWEEANTKIYALGEWESLYK